MSASHCRLEHDLGHQTYLWLYGTDLSAWADEQDRIQGPMPKGRFLGHHG